MLLREVLRESFRSVFANVGRTTVLFVALALVGAGVVGWNGFDAKRLRDLEVRQRDEGASIVVVVGHPSIAVDDCRTASAKGSVHSGAAAEADRVSSRSMPGSSFRHLVVTDGFIGIVGGVTEAGLDRGVFVGSAAADELGLVSGDVASFEGIGTQRVAVLEQRGTRTEAVDRSIMVVDPARVAFDQCYIEFGRPEPDHLVGVALGMAGANPTYTVNRLIAPDKFAGSPALQFSERSSRYAVYAAIPLVYLVLAMVLRGRRSEFALFNACGCTRSTVTLIVLIESWGFSLALLTGGWMAAVALGGRPTDAGFLSAGFLELMPVIGALPVATLVIMTLLQRNSLWEMARIGA